MSFVLVLILTAINWALKLLMAWIAFHFTHWIFTDPAEWVVIAIVAVAACGTSINYSWTDVYGRKWSIQ
ncbi:hypothetical protein PP753_gp16 [Dinoroseobacter phage vB_DshP-R7L]|uniref:Uncharacterized protein n=1 Tax=Dinoroseobacter phage vB_DshP-R7L TaxID=2873349 RepID=A0AAE8XBU5_9CAUD|nr:hypothetical protein PP753_gp16 [Dinoroseobacter phage vB_DshP-R7L]UAT28855.1 hypothetical protein R7L_gp16 [Dinoroseobacter phage vB_DshP-R7L]